MNELQNEMQSESHDAQQPDPVAARRARRHARAQREHRRGRVAQMRFLALVAVSVLGTSALAAPVAALDGTLRSLDGHLAVLLHAASSFLG